MQDRDRHGGGVRVEGAIVRLVSEGVLCRLRPVMDICEAAIGVEGQGAVGRVGNLDGA